MQIAKLKKNAIPFAAVERTSSNPCSDLNRGPAEAAALAHPNQRLIHCEQLGIDGRDEGYKVSIADGGLNGCQPFRAFGISLDAQGKSGQMKTVQKSSI